MRYRKNKGKVFAQRRPGRVMRGPLSDPKRGPSEKPQTCAAETSGRGETHSMGPFSITELTGQSFADTDPVEVGRLSGFMQWSASESSQSCRTAGTGAGDASRCCHRQLFNQNRPLTRSLLHSFLSAERVPRGLCPRARWTGQDAARGVSPTCCLSRAWRDPTGEPLSGGTPNIRKTNNTTRSC